MQGRRLPDSTWPDVLSVGPDGDLRDGDYWFCQGSPRRNEGFDGSWYVYYHGAAGISLHHVEEHEDGTITVVPQPGNSNSIAIYSGQQQVFHGFIRRGVWE